MILPTSSRARKTPPHHRAPRVAGIDDVLVDVGRHCEHREKIVASRTQARLEMPAHLEHLQRVPLEGQLHPAAVVRRRTSVSADSTTARRSRRVSAPSRDKRGWPGRRPDSTAPTTHAHGTAASPATGKPWGATTSPRVLRSCRGWNIHAGTSSVWSSRENRTVRSASSRRLQLLRQTAPRPHLQLVPQAIDTDRRHRSRRPQARAQIAQSLQVTPVGTRGNLLLDRRDLASQVLRPGEVLRQH